MPVGAIVALVLILVLLAAVALARIVITRRMALRRRFGAEYDRLAREIGPRRASAELMERQRRAEKLDIRPLSAEKRAGYENRWTAAQQQFVDSPAQAVKAAANLVTAVAADRGYSVGDHAGFIADLSVHHADRLDGYKRARQTAEQATSATTEELRQALLEYRELFLELAGAPGSVAAPPVVPADAGADTEAEAGAETDAEAGADTEAEADADTVASQDALAAAQPTEKG